MKTELCRAAMLYSDHCTGFQMEKCRRDGHILLLEICLNHECLFGWSVQTTSEEVSGQSERVTVSFCAQPMKDVSSRKVGRNFCFSSQVKACLAGSNRGTKQMMENTSFFFPYYQKYLIDTQREYTTLVKIQDLLKKRILFLSNTVVNTLYHSFWPNLTSGSLSPPSNCSSFSSLPCLWTLLWPQGSLPLWLSLPAPLRQQDLHVLLSPQQHRIQILLQRDGVPDGHAAEPHRHVRWIRTQVS